MLRTEIKLEGNANKKKSDKRKKNRVKMTVGR